MTDQAPLEPVDPSAGRPATAVDADVSALHADLKAENAPTFEVLPLSPELRQTLAEIGYKHPTPVQIAVWEPATRGRDAVVQARTGTGKTAAFGLPIVDHVVKRSLNQAQVLALCPTRELAIQVASEIERLGSKKGVKVCAVYGGAPMQKQIDAIEGGAQVIVGTPGRTLDHLRRGTLDPKHVRMVVLDEADEMLSMGFERELTAILETLPPERQTVLFSATLPPDIERIARTKLRTPDFLTLSGDHVGALSIQHFVYMVASDKIGALTRVLEVEDPEGAVIFCNTKDATEAVAQALKRQGLDADWLNGDLAQNDREKVMSATREGRLRYLVATDVAARGIDISHLTHVINYDFPQDAEAYVHRTGRTGRAGKTGTAVSLVTPQDIGQLYLLRLTYKIRPLEKQIPSEGELKTRAEADLVSMLAEAFTARAAHPDDLALARRLLTHDRIDAILAGLLRDHLGARPEAKDDAAARRRAPRPVAPPRTAPARAASTVAERPAGWSNARPPVPEMPRPEPAQRTPRREDERAEASVPTEPTGAASGPRPERDGGRRERGRGRGDRPERGDRAPREPHEAVSWAGPGQDGSARAEGEREGRRARRPERGAADPSASRPASGESPGANVDVAAGSTDVAANAAKAPPSRPREDRRTAPETTQAGQRPRLVHELVSWQPPEEENDDEPILGDGPAPRSDAVVTPRAVEPRAAQPPRAAAPPPQRREEEALEGDWVELYVNVGRRDGARALDVQTLLVDGGGLDKDAVRRIRVRDRNAFVSVPRADADKALAALNGASLGGKSAMAEIARSNTPGAAGEADKPSA